MIVAYKPVTEQSTMYEQLVEYKTNITNSDAQVVVIGDSTGLSGIDPLVFKKHSSLKMNNLCLYGYAKPVGWYTLLNAYLKKNQKPKVVVIYYTAPTPATFHVLHFEEIFVKFRYFSPHVFFHFPQKFNPFHNISVLLTWSTNKLQPPPATSSGIKFVMQHKGYMAFYGTRENKPLDSRPAYNVQDKTLKEGFQEILNLRNLIEKEGIKTLIYVHAVSDIDLALAYYKAFYEGKVDNKIYTLPHKYFNDQTHLNHRGAKKNTKIFAEFLKNHGF